MNDQRSLLDQLRELIELANKNGLYDAADFLAQYVADVSKLPAYTEQTTLQQIVAIQQQLVEIQVKLVQNEQRYIYELVASAEYILAGVKSELEKKEQKNER